MKNPVLLSLILLLALPAISQSKYEEINSVNLGTNRSFKVQLPRNYNENVDRTYPLILVFDGDYIFEPVVGNVDYFSYWEDMPEAIVVGVIQEKTRYKDVSYNSENFTLDENGIAFYNFIKKELIPYVKSNYRVSNFNIGVGHDLTANFINYFLLNDPTLFGGYICISPEFDPSMQDQITARLESMDKKVNYYLATGSNDFPESMEISEKLNYRLSAIKNKKLDYFYDNFKGGNHYSIVTRGVPNAIEKIFSIYRPITEEEYTNVLLTMDGSIHQYLVDKYATIEELFGIINVVRENDFLAVAAAAAKRQQWDSLREIADMAIKQYPETQLGYYYMGRYHEETGSPKKAMRLYQGAYRKKSVSFINTLVMLSRAKDIKDTYGY